MGAVRTVITAGRIRPGFQTGVIWLMRRSRGHVLALAYATAFLCASPAFANQRVIADFDGDGVRDQVSLSRHDPTVVRVWLSSTRRIDVIHSREPILQIAAADLDGDARKELVARVPTSMRVWVRRNGHFQSYRPRHRAVTSRISRARSHGSNADPLNAELSVTEYSLIAPSLESTVLALPPPRVAWTDGTNPVRGPSSGAPVHPFTPRPPPLS
jgi:hypothetical protein